MEISNEAIITAAVTSNTSIGEKMEVVEKQDVESAKEEVIIARESETGDHAANEPMKISSDKIEAEKEEMDISVAQEEAITDVNAAGGKREKSSSKPTNSPRVDIPALDLEICYRKRDRSSDVFHVKHNISQQEEEERKKNANTNSSTNSGSVTLPKQRDIFSVSGSPSGRIVRHRDQVSVFPNGCFGNPALDEHQPSLPTSPRKFADAREVRECSSLIESTPRKRPMSGRPDLVGRNPLTGEGVQCLDERREKTTRRRDGNPLLGVGYDNDDNQNRDTKNEAKKEEETTNHHHNARVPPGGVSHGIW